MSANVAAIRLTLTTAPDTELAFPASTHSRGRRVVQLLAVISVSAPRDWLVVLVIASCARPLWQCYDSPWQYARLLGRSMMPFRQSSGSVMGLQVKARIGEPDTAGVVKRQSCHRNHPRNLPT